MLYWVINLGVSIGFTLAGILASRSFMLLFVGDGLTSLAFAFLVWRGVPETRPVFTATPHDRPRAGLVRGFFAPYMDQPFALLVLLSVLILLVFMQHLAALPVAITMGGVPKALLGVVLALNGILIVFVQPPLAPRLGRRNPSRMLALGALLVGVGFGMNALGRSALLFSVATMVWTVGEIFTLPIANAVVAEVARPEMRGRYQGAYGLAFGVAGFGAPLLGMSVLQRFGSGALWMGCLGLGLVVAIGHLALEPRLTRLRDLRQGRTPALRAGT
jgi:MFS family permease